MKRKTKTVYFSHSKSLYNTEEEKIVRSEIERIINCKIICPNLDIGDCNDAEIYRSSVINSKLVLVWSESNYGILTKGCYSDVNNALIYDVPTVLIELNGRSIDLRQIVTIEKFEDGNFFEYGCVESVSINLNELHQLI